MYRLFVAIRPPASIRAALIAIMGGVAGARWQNDAQLHLTLRFIGDVDGRLGDDVVAALGSIVMRPFDIALHGIGSFDDRGRPNALWAGVTPHDDLARLHRKVDQACVRAGLAPESRAYLPHITIARLKRDSGAIDGFANAHGGLVSPSFPVESFALYESHLGSDGARYEIIEAFPLRA